MLFPVSNFAVARSSQKSYIGNTVIFTANEMRYTNNFVQHNILNVNVSYVYTAPNTTITIVIGTSSFTYTLDSSFQLIGNVINNSQNSSIFIGYGPNLPIIPDSNIGSVVTITFINTNDIYLINLSTNLHIPYDSASLIVYRLLTLQFDRQNEGIATSDILSTPVELMDNIEDPCELLEIPIINIVGQTTFDCQWLSDVTFTILDKYKYYKEEPLELTCKKCKPIYAKRSQLKETRFLQYGPCVYNVLKGCGDTLFKKIQSVWTKHQPTDDFNVFYERIFLYSMSKYILCRILYGQFDIHYLLQKYNKQFLKDLKHSRFCGGLKLFLDPRSVVYGYNKYFLKCMS